jgi:transcriptional regulator with PAS, ATPase and Fis domain
MKMNWSKELDAVITVCDTQGIILEMNDKSILYFTKYGGAKLIGKNLLDCHPEPSKSMLRMMMQKQQKNTYLVENNGLQKLISQQPWFQDGEYRGFIEIQIELAGPIALEK